MQLLDLQWLSLVLSASQQVINLPQGYWPFPGYVPCLSACDFWWWCQCLESVFTDTAAQLSRSCEVAQYFYVIELV